MPAAARGDARVRNFDGVGCAGCGVTTCRRWHFAPTTDILDLLDLNGEALDQSWMAELQEQLTARLQREADAVARAAAAGCSDARQSELKQQQAETKARLAALKDGKHTLGKPRMWFCTGKEQKSSCRTAKGKAERVVEWDGSDLPAASTLRTAHAGALAIAPHPEGASHGHHVVPAWMLRAIPTSKAAADLINLDPPYTLEDVGKLQRQVHEYPDAEPEPHPEPTSELYRTFLCARRGSMLSSAVDKRHGRLPWEQSILILPEECDTAEKLAEQVTMRFFERVGFEEGHVDAYVGYLISKHGERRCTAQGMLSFALPTREAFIQLAEMQDICVSRNAIVEVEIDNGLDAVSGEGGWGSTIEVDMQPLMQERERLSLSISVKNEFGFVHVLGAHGSYVGMCWAERFLWKPEAECERLPVACTPTRRSQRKTPAKKPRQAGGGPES